MGEQSGLYRIRVFQDGECVATHVVRSRSVTVGRDSSSDVQVAGSKVSRRHAQIDMVNGGALRVRDLGSKNGIHVGDDRVHDQEFGSDVVLRLGGGVELAIEMAGTSEAATAEAELPVLAGIIASNAETGPIGMLRESDTFLVSPKGNGSSDGKVVCPHCWHEFGVDEILAVAEHPDLLDDPVLGEDAQQRFLPSRFTPDGQPIDAFGVVCPDLACPRCRLVVPRSLAQKAPLFFSIIGAPASGKSYLLTTMVWQLRGLMASQFGLTFTDADSTSNERLNQYERTLFLPAQKETYTTLEKTEMQGSMYDRVLLNNMEVRLPRPLMFSVIPQPHHVFYQKKRAALEQTLVLYDNAGEHFQPGADSASDPGTQHLVRSSGIFFLFDPSKDPRFRAKCPSSDPQMKDGAQVEPQETLLTESIARITRHSRSTDSGDLDRPIVVIVTKYDIWHSLLRYPLPKPWRRTRSLATAGLDLDAIGVASVAVRHMLMQICPELVAAVEAHSSAVTYLPTSATGHSPSERRVRDPEGKTRRALLVRPKDIRPIWAAVPMLCMLARFGIVPIMRLARPDSLPVATNCRLSGRLAAMDVPGTNQRLELPVDYMGQAMRCPETGVWFWAPSVEEARGAKEQGTTKGN